jgi:hypothetical protein
VTPDQIGLLIKGLRHGRAILLVAIKPTDEKQARIAPNFHCMAVSAVWWKYTAGIVLNHWHRGLSLQTGWENCADELSPIRLRTKNAIL